MLWSESKLKRSRACGRYRVSSDQPIAVNRHQAGEDGEGYAYYSGVQTCGSPWSCPVCSAKIRQRRAEEIELAVMLHLSSGGGVEFLTLTMPHDEGDRLEAMRKAQADAWSYVMGSYGGRKDREEYGVAGYIRVLEVTHGPSGWHPHLHVLLFTERPLRAPERDGLHARLYGRWAKRIRRNGYRSPRKGLCRMNVVRCPSEVGVYMAKAALCVDDAGDVRRVGMEMMRHDLKQGRESPSRGRGKSRNRTPWEILRSFAETGDEAELDLWHEYETGMKGARSVQFSQGLKDRLGLTETTDEELAEEEVGGEDLAWFTDAEWRLICSVPHAPARMLEVAEAEGRRGVEVYLQTLRRRSSKARGQPIGP